jgi:hypothetical protein
MERQDWQSIHIAAGTLSPTIGGKYDSEPVPSVHHPEAHVLTRNEDTGQWIVIDYRPKAIDGAGYTEVIVRPSSHD